MTDVQHQINAVSRVVGSVALEAGQARTLTISQTYAAPLADVWDACTSAERIPRWFLPVSGDLVLGGRYQLEGNAQGTISECDPPRGFDVTWEYGSEVSWVEVRLSDEGPDRTRFELHHIAHVDDERWAQFGPGAVGIGWDSGLLGLAGHLSSGTGVDPADAMAWMASPEGVDFITRSSAAWAEASIVAGTDAAAATAAMHQCTAAYTGVEVTPAS